MNTVAQVMAELKKHGDEQTRKTLARHGAPQGTLGVKIANLKTIAKRIKGNQLLACELYKTGIADAMYLAGIVADGSQMTKRQLQDWVEGAKWHMQSEYTVPWVATESPFARELAMRWIKSKKESIATSGWSTYSGIVAVTPDEELDLAEIESLLDYAVEHIHTAPNYVRSTMNSFVISVGAYVQPLHEKAKAAANAIGVVSVDMGDTACKTPLASEYIAKVEAAGRVGKKRKTIKC